MGTVRGHISSQKGYKSIPSVTTPASKQWTHRANGNIYVYVLSNHFSSHTHTHTHTHTQTQGRRGKPRKSDGWRYAMAFVSLRAKKKATKGKRYFFHNQR